MPPTAQINHYTHFLSTHQKDAFMSARFKALLKFVAVDPSATLVNLCS